MSSATWTDEPMGEGPWLYQVKAESRSGRPYQSNVVQVSSAPKTIPPKNNSDLSAKLDLEKMQNRIPRQGGLQPGLGTIALTVHFAPDSAEILPHAIPNLQSLGQALQSPQLASYCILIEAHTDNIGSDAYNLQLSKRRAVSVKRYLVQNFDINPQNFITEGRGSREPMASNQTRVGRRKNRRIEFVTLGKKNCGNM